MIRVVDQCQQEDQWTKNGEVLVVEEISTEEVEAAAHHSVEVAAHTADINVLAELVQV